MRKETGKNPLIQVGQATTLKREMLDWPPCAQKHLRELAHADVKPNREKRGLHGAVSVGDRWGIGGEPDVRGHGEGAVTQVVWAGQTATESDHEEESAAAGI